MTQAPKEARTLDQRRAKDAWDAVRRLERHPDNHAKEYAMEAKKLPMRIMAAGLGHALAFVDAKANAKPAMKQLLVDLTDWVIGKRGLKGSAPESLLASIVAGDAIFLRRATEEALAYLQWLNRFVEAKGLGDQTGRGS